MALSLLGLQSGLEIVVFNFFKDHEMKRVLIGENVGTLIREEV